jgi:hypothetical protein
VKKDILLGSLGIHVESHESHLRSKYTVLDAQSDCPQNSFKGPVSKTIHITGSPETGSKQ